MFGGAPYTKCEWLDTFSQAPYQELDYQNFATWDWNIPISQDEEAECVMVAFIEGDDMEQHCYPGGFNPCGSTAFQHPTDLSEDLIALFKVERNNIQQVYRNHKHSPHLPSNIDWDFEVVFSNGNLPNCQSSSGAQ